MRHDNFIPTPRYVRIRSRGHLPHWQVDDAIYFVTFRLDDSLPRDVAMNLKAERERVLRDAAPSERAMLDRAFSVRLDQHLDAGHGSCLLRAHGEIVAGAVRHFDGVRYKLQAWCVMPNHVHVMFHLDRGEELPKIRSHMEDIHSVSDRAWEHLAAGVFRSADSIAAGVRGYAGLHSRESGEGRVERLGVDWLMRAAAGRLRISRRGTPALRVLMLL